MIIKGVTGGKERGNPVEYSTEEKFPIAIKHFLKTQAPEGEVWIFTKVEFKDKSFVPVGANAKGWANNNYLASGKVWYKTLDVKTDRLYGEKALDFKIDFQDSTDGFGMPDLQLNKFELH